MRARWLSLTAALALARCTPYGVYHVVEPQQTLYRIAKTYEVPLQSLAEVNNIEDPAQIRVGQEIFIPGRDYERRVDVIGQRMDPGKPKPGATPKPKPAQPKPSSGKDYEPGKEVKTQKGLFSWPVQGKLLSPFGIRNGEAHDGIDIGAKEGTPIVAAADGKVIYSDDELRGYGNLIIIKHEGYFATVYAHNEENLVKTGQFVERGQKIATVGDTGNASTPHLHFEVREKNKPRNPIFFLP